MSAGSPAASSAPVCAASPKRQRGQRPSADAGSAGILQATRWWDYSLGDLAQFSFDDPEAFCTAFEAASPGLSPRQVKALTAAEVQRRFEEPDAKPADAVLVCNFDNGDSRDSSGNEIHGVGAGVESGKGKVGGALWFKGGADGGGKGGKNSGSFVKHSWDRFVPIVARSMALAGKTVLVSGAPDMIDEEYAFERLAAKDPAILQELKEQDEALEGRRGAKMWAVNTETGEQSTGLELTSPPVWDGITVAQGRVYVSTMDGRLQCFGK